MFKPHEYWVQSLPTGWRWRRVREAFILMNGYPYKSDKFNLVGEGRPVVRIRDLLGEGLPTSYSGDDGQQIVVKNGNLVIGMDGDFNCVFWSKGEALLNQRVAALKEKSNSAIISRFAFYQIPTALKVINNLTPASTVKHLASSDISALRLPCPNLDTQREIANFLDAETFRIDALIEKKQQLVAALKLREKSMLEAAVLHGMSSENKLQSGPLWRGGIPDGWTRHKIRHLYRPAKRQQHEGEAVLSVFREYGVVIKDEYEGNHNKTPDDLSLYQLVEPSDLVINKMKAWQGSLGISKHRGITSPDYTVLTPLHNEYDKFLHYLLRIPRMAFEYSVYSTGVRPAQWRLDIPRFLDMSVWLPSYEEQVSLVERIDKSFNAGRRLAEKTAQSIDCLTELRTSLITAAVTGMIDPATYQRQGATDRTLDRIEKELSK